MQKKESVPLFYWNAGNNFGDELSRYIVQKICNTDVRYVDRHKKNKLVAVGSLLMTATLYSKSDIWGSGFLFQNRLSEEAAHLFPLNKYLKACYKRLFRKSKIHAVRGPLSRSILLKFGFECPAIYGDPALLMPRYYKPQESSQKNKTGLILHWTQEKRINPEELKNSDLTLISILRKTDEELEKFVDEVCSCEKIFTTSLHGLIIAQAYGIPAQWIKLKDSEIHKDSDFKFNDYFLGAGQIVQKPLIIERFNEINNEVAIPEIQPFYELETLLNAFPKKYINDSK